MKDGGFPQWQRDSLAIHAEDKPVGKAGRQAATCAELNLGAGHRESRGATDCPVDFIEELPPQPRCLFVVPVDRVVEFLPGHGKKTNFHGRRCLAMTVS